MPLKAMLEVMTKFFLERLVTENMDNTQHPTTRCVDERYLLPFATAGGPISRRGMHYFRNASCNNLVRKRSQQENY